MIEVLPLAVPTGPAVVDLMAHLLAALAGTGPAIAPTAAGPESANAAGRVRSVPGAAIDAGPIALLINTSGSTGAPKTVLLPASAVAHAAAAGERRLMQTPPGATQQPVNWLLALPPQHIAGLLVLIRAGLAGRVPTFLYTAGQAGAAGAAAHGSDGPGFHTPARFTVAAFEAATARLPSGPALVSLVPTQLHRLLSEPAGVDVLRRYSSVLVGGAATPPDLVARAATAGIRLTTSYGMTETVGGCVYDGIPLDGMSAVTGPVGVGEPNGPGGHGAPGPVGGVGGTVGPIVLTGPMVAAGYQGLPFGGPFSRDPETGARSFTTSDLGSIDDATDRVTVLGRVDDVLITGGVNVAPQAVEDLLSGAPGVAQLVLSAVPDAEWGSRLVAVVVPTVDGPVPDLDDLRLRVAAAMNPAAAPRALLIVEDLPLRGPGKIDRSAIADLARTRIGPADSGA